MARLTWDQKNRRYYKRQLTKAIDYCNSIGWSVSEKSIKVGESHVDFHDKNIVITSRQRPELKLYTLLHEVGHVIIRSHAEYRRKFPCYNNTLRANKKERVCTIEEEVMAWHTAYELAGTLKIRINKKIFERDKTSALMSYIKWAARMNYERA